MYTTSIKTTNKIAKLSGLDRIIQQGGPEKSDYQLMDQISNKILSAIDNNEIDMIDFKENLDQMAVLNTTKSIMGHVLNKPYGYAGDFDIIDKIYLNKPVGLYAKWDKYTLNNAACNAVRNRKEYFKNLILSKAGKGDNLDICDVASGPARDLKEMYDLLRNKNSVKTTCVELDKRAINHAKNLTKDYKSQIEFVNKNILRFSTDQKFDIVWSAGLFDYFNDNLFVRLLSRFMEWVKPGGEVVIGNFNSEHNPSRAYMELFGEWFLNHRSPAEMRHLAIMAGAEPHQITVEQEEEGINLFLRIKC